MTNDENDLNDNNDDRFLNYHFEHVSLKSFIII